MKKVILLFIVIAMSVGTVVAQGKKKDSNKWFWVGAKAGMVSEANKLNFDAATGFNAGFTFRFNLPFSIFSVNLTPEILYNWSKFTPSEGSDFEPGTIKIREFSAPVLLGFGIDLGLFNARVQAGPVFSFGSKVSLNGGDLGSIGDEFSTPLYSWALGFGIDLFNFVMVDFRYLGGWKEDPEKFFDIFKFSKIDTANKSWSLSVGVMF